MQCWRISLFKSHNIWMIKQQQIRKKKFETSVCAWLEITTFKCMMGLKHVLDRWKKITRTVFHKWSCNYGGKECHRTSNDGEESDCNFLWISFCLFALLFKNRMNSCIDSGCMAALDYYGNEWFQWNEQKSFKQP